ncbi:MAG: CHAT domain-containing protein [Gaiella sp.]
MAEAALAGARKERSPRAEVAALHALGFAQNALGDPAMVATLRTAVRVAHRAGLRPEEARARLALAGALAHFGAIPAALRAIGDAYGQLDRGDRARAEVFRLGLLFHSEEPFTETARSAAALRLFRERGDELWEARLLFNRGIVLLGRGGAAKGLPDLQTARSLYARRGAHVAVAETDAAIAEARLLAGDLQGALRDLDGIGLDLPASTRTDIELSKARALAAAMLLDEARQAFRNALHGMRDGGATDRRLKTAVELARLLSLAGDHKPAAGTARAAARAFDRRRQPVAAARARTVALGAQVGAGRVLRPAINAAIADAETLVAAGWHEEARRARLTIARAALLAGEIELAELQHRVALGIGGRPSVADRLLLADVGASLRLATGDPRSAARIAAGGLALLERFRLGLGSVELRARAAALGADLASLGLRVAIAEGRARRIFDWSERLRANSLLVRADIPHDPEIAAAQQELRRIERTFVTGDRGGAETAKLSARQALVERRIARRARHVADAGVAVGRQRPAREVLRALGERALAQYVEVDSRLHLLVARAGRVRHYELCPASAIEEPLTWLRFGLRLMSRSDLSRSRREAAARTVERALLNLDGLLLDAAKPQIGGAEIVLVPGSRLHALPWAMFSSLRGRPLTVAPSASLWVTLHEGATGGPRGPVVCVAGPRLRHARREAQEIASLHPGAVALTGEQATVAAALRALDGAAVAHLACHGRFRSDSPLFSSFLLADGSLTTYDLQSLRRPPGVLVLSSCDLALSEAHPGEELLGLAATLLGMGTRTIVASVAPVPDRQAPTLMRAFHRALLAGAGPAAALASAQGANASGHPEPAGFVCLGS